MDRTPQVAINTRAQPETFRARELMASLTVKDVAASLTWYTGVMSFTLNQKYERDGKLIAVSVKAGDVNLLLNQDDGKKGERVKGEGFSLQLTTAQDIDEVAGRIKKNGGTLASEPQDTPWGTRMFRMADPDGFKFAISSEKKG